MSLIIRPRCFGMMTPDAYCQSVKSSLKLTYCFSVVPLAYLISAMRPKYRSPSFSGFGEVPPTEFALPQPESRNVAEPA